MSEFFFTQLYDEADMQEEKVRISRCIGSIKSDELKKKVLDFAMSDKVRSQDTVFVIGGVTGTVQGRELCWQFVQDKWTELHERYKGGFLLSRLVEVTFLCNILYRYSILSQLLNTFNQFYYILFLCLVKLEFCLFVTFIS